jgi:hypothetical protein
MDFVFKTKSGDFIPLQVKSAENVNSKSLKTYQDIYKPSYSIRVTAKTLSLKTTLRVSLYMPYSA